MKLYYARGACSLAPHIVLRELALPFDLVRVPLNTHRTDDGVALASINPKDQVPALVLDDGALVTEVAVIVQYLADLRPASKLAPPAGTMERVRLQEWLNFVGTELHKSFSTLFGTAAPESYKDYVRGKIGERLALLEAELATRPYLLGDDFTVADAYAFTILRWAGRITKVDLAPYPHVVAYVARVAALPFVRVAMDAEGLR
jgi:glutathione S-transferase